jgi:hypothetical protein
MRESITHFGRINPQPFCRFCTWLQKPMSAHELLVQNGVRIRAI